MGCEESFITMKLIWHGYLVPSLDICVYETSTETGLRMWISQVEDEHLWLHFSYQLTSKSGNQLSKPIRKITVQYIQLK